MVFKMNINKDGQSVSYSCGGPLLAERVAEEVFGKLNQKEEAKK